MGLPSFCSLTCEKKLPGNGYDTFLDLLFTAAPTVRSPLIVVSTFSAFERPVTADDVCHAHARRYFGA